MNHPTLPIHTLRDKLALAAIGTGWVGLIGFTVATLSVCLFVGRILSAPFRKL